MSNHHHENREQQMNKKTHGLAPSQREKMFYQGNETKNSEGIQKNATVDDGSVQLLAYQIYCKRGGSAIDNWLEAEKILKNKNTAGFHFKK